MLWILGIVFFIGMILHWDKKQGKGAGNPYIKIHRMHLKNDMNYDEYLKWCRKNGEIPMDKKVFIKEIENRNNKIKKLVK